MNRTVVLFGILFFVYASTINAFACNPAVPAICEAYSRAKSVFIGTLTKVEKIKDSDLSEVYAHFSVKKVYKGAVNKTEIVRFDTGDCGVKISEIGKEYFVYNEPYTSFASVANLTGLVKDSQSSIKYAESLSNKHPIYTISGWMTGLTPDEMKKVIVEIRDGSSSHPLKLKEYSFNFIAKHAATYTVKITIPFDGFIWTKIIDGGFYSLFESDGRSTEYTVQFKPNECDFRRIEIDKQ
jgi:hypothetical protein